MNCNIPGETVDTTAGIELEAQDTNAEPESQYGESQRLSIDPEIISHESKNADHEEQVPNSEPEYAVIDNVW